MHETWFTSDHHFGHKNILEYEKESRPFKTIEEMNEHLIGRWNLVVNPKDIVYHLGDFAFGLNNIAIAERLNGQKRLVLGNHDTYTSSNYLHYFDKLHGIVFWENCILSHIPVHVDCLGSRWFFNVHGHLHSKEVLEVYEIDRQGYKYYRPDKNYFNVSVERNNLTPIHADIIRQRCKELQE